MAIKGNLREAGLPDVLQLLAMGQKTGCLSLSDRSNFGYIFFDRGRITYASIVNRRDRLGDLLVKNELLRQDQLLAAIEEQGRSPALKLGEILIRRGAITREQLESYIRIQIEEAVYYLFTWTQGSFYFEADQRPEEGAFLVSINPENLLLEGARRIDEWSLIEKKIPSLELVFELDRAKSLEGFELAEEQRKLLPLLDGKRTVQEIIDESGMVEFDVGKALFGLIQAGFAHPVGRRSPAEQKEVPQARIDEHRNLGIAFYKTGMYEESTREFRRVAELQPSNVDARFHLALIGLRKGDDRMALRYFREATELGGARGGVFQGMSLALERLGRLQDARFASEEAVRLAPRKPQVSLSRAVLILKSGDPHAAADAFAAYRESVTGKLPAAYFAFATLAEAAAGRADRAVEIGSEGAALHPHSAVVHLHLGAVQERRGDWDAAEQAYRRATEEDGDLPQAQKGLGDALYRRGAFDEAAAAFSRAIQLSPELGDDVYFRLGNIHYKRMDRPEAVRLWRRALEINPQNTVVRTNLELVERVMG